MNHAGASSVNTLSFVFFKETTTILDTSFPLKVTLFIILHITMLRTECTRMMHDSLVGFLFVTVINRIHMLLAILTLALLYAILHVCSYHCFCANK